MRNLGAYRIASYLLVLFCLGHTAGGMLAQKSLGPESDAVFSAMKAVHFDFNGSRCSWYDFWFGFGLMTSIFLLFSAVASWCLAHIEATHWTSVSLLAWAFFASHAALAVLCWAYFFFGSALLATVIAVLLGVGALRNQMAAAAYVSESLKTDQAPPA